MNLLRLSAALVLYGALITGSAHAEPLTLLDGPTQLRFVDSTAPAVLLRTLNVTGMLASETIAGIDYRPQNSALYAVGFLGGDARLYTINTTSGVATPVAAGNTPFHATLGSQGYIGMDFNPVVDRIRIVSNLGTNLRVNPNDGTLVATDTQTDFAASDSNFGINNEPIGLAYANNVAGAASTTLYGIVYANGATLATVGSVSGAPTSPNSGQMFTVGLLGWGGYSGSRQGFDISSSGTAYAVIDNNNELYSINLNTGAGTSLGAFPAGTAIRDLSAGPAASNSVALTAIPALDAQGLLALAAMLAIAGGFLVRRRT